MPARFLPCSVATLTALGRRRSLRRSPRSSAAPRDWNERGYRWSVIGYRFPAARRYRKPITENRLQEERLMATTAAPKKLGRVVQVIGPVLDVAFAAEELPKLYTALRITGESDTGDRIDVTAEVEQHIGRNQVRAVAMSSTDAVVRGMEVVDTGGPITVPVGAAALGRILNVLGEPVDMGEPIPADVE